MYITVVSARGRIHDVSGMITSPITVFTCDMRMMKDFIFFYISTLSLSGSILTSEFLQALKNVIFTWLYRSFFKAILIIERKSLAGYDEKPITNHYPVHLRRVVVRF